MEDDGIEGENENHNYLDNNIDEQQLYESENYDTAHLNNEESPLKENKILGQEINFTNDITNNKQSMQRLIQEQYIQYIASFLFIIIYLESNQYKVIIEVKPVYFHKNLIKFSMYQILKIYLNHQILLA